MIFFILRQISPKQLQFDIDFLAIEHVADGEVDEHEVEGVGEGGPLQGGDDGVDAIVDPLGDAPIAQEDGQQLTGDIEGEGVDTEDVEERSPA